MPAERLGAPGLAPVFMYRLASKGLITPRTQKVTWVAW
jgi:hypothetical protein